MAEGAAPPTTAFEQAVAALFARILRPHVLAGRANLGVGRDGGPALPPAWTGAEVWCQTYEAGRGLDFHFDKDEAAMAGGGVMRNPAVACVVYLSGERGGVGGVPGPLRQGPTVVQDQRWRPDGGGRGEDGDPIPGPVPPAPGACALAWPVSGSAALFAGTRAHGVLGSPLGVVRAALLVNFWAGDPPGRVGRVPAAVAAGLAGPVDEEVGAGPAPTEVVPVEVVLTAEAAAAAAAPGKAATGGRLAGHALGGVLAGLVEGGRRPPDLLVVRHLGLDLVEADGGGGPEAAWVAV